MPDIKVSQDALAVVIEEAADIECSQIVLIIVEEDWIPASQGSVRISCTT